MTAAPEEEKRQGGEVRTSPFDVFQGGRERKKEEGEREVRREKGKKTSAFSHIGKEKLLNNLRNIFTMATVWFLTSIIHYLLIQNVPKLANSYWGPVARVE